ncbi:hypothetical protein BZM27_38280 [Paraburkholderia steynii]|uniref:Transcriptional regulator n=1 Tax=Paraburkholderia steynii TaxID=1245441 RepID=A0A4R0X3V4_9BURK|nr:hypothetical protein BZM27_38280 [Paraburkholderia steynii]
MSLRSKVWVSVGLLCVSMAAHAEYKEVWNPPEAAQHVRHSKHAASSAGSGAAKAVHQGKSTPHAKVAAKASVSSGKTNKTGAAVKTAHAPAPRDSSQKPARAKPVVAMAKPRQVAQSSAPQTSSTQPPRELPPILH